MINYIYIFINTFNLKFFQFFYKKCYNFFILLLRVLFENKRTNVLTSIVLIICYITLWNTLHSEMHFIEDELSWEEGIPSQRKYFHFNNSIYKWLLKNHSLHHFQKNKKGNFNIILPGFDIIFNTFYNYCYDNTEYCKNNKNDDKVCKDKNKIKNCL